MKNQINLITQRVDTKKNVRKIFLASFIVFCISFFFSALLLLMVLFQNSEITNLSSQKSQLESSIASQREARENAALIKERLSEINKVLSSRFDLNVKLAQILSILPPSLTVQSVDVSKEKIAITASSLDLSDFDAFLDDRIVALDPIKDLKDIKRIDMNSFRIDRKTAEYSLTLTFNLNQGIRKVQ